MTHLCNCPNDDLQGETTDRCACPAAVGHRKLGVLQKAILEAIPLCADYPGRAKDVLRKALDDVKTIVDTGEGD